MRTRTLQNIVLVLLPFWVSAQQLHITAGSQLVMNGPVHLVMNNIGFSNDGNFIADSSTVLFTGETGAQVNSIIGNNIPIFNHLTLHTGALSGVYLQQSITVKGRLGMEVGNLQLNGYDISLGNIGAIIGESSASRIEDPSPGTGWVYANRKMIAPQAVNPGNIGVEITSNANMGITRIFRYFKPQTFSTGGSGIARWYTISPSNNIVLDAKLRVHYLDEELNGNSEFALHLWTGSDIMDAWLDVGVDNSDEDSNWVELSGIDHFNRVTLASGGGNGTGMRVSPPIVAYPNPSHNQVGLSLTSSQEKDVAMGLYDQTGQLLQRRMMHFYKGANTLIWDLSSFPTGIYFIGSIDGSIKKVKTMKL